MASVYVRAANPIWYFVDLEGLGLNDEYYAFFLQNVTPFAPQNVYETPNGTPWAFPLQFLPNGTLPDNLYFDDQEVYRIEIRHGNTQADPLVYEINNFVPGIGGGSISSESQSTSNQITNPQFVQYNLSPPSSNKTFSTSGTYDIAPGWKLLLSGTGTCLVKRNEYAANQNIPNNPPYTIQIQTSGSWTNVQLYQTFSGNGGLWTTDDGQVGAILGSVTARAIGTTYDLSMLYRPSAGTANDLVIAHELLPVGVFDIMSGSVLTNPSDNNDPSADSFIDIVFQLQNTGNVELSNIQVIGQTLPEGTVDLPTPIVFQQETVERNTDHLFHYYQNSILMQPKKSILTGWNFSLNPFQFPNTAAQASPGAITTIALQTSYIADQTILYQEGTSLLNSGYNGTISHRYALQVGAVTSAAASRMALIQYLDPSAILPYWSYKLSALVKASLFSTHSTSIGVKMRLIYRSGTTGSPNLPATLSAVEPILSWAANSDPVFSSGWTSIAPLNDPEYVLEINSGSFEFPAYAFNSFQLPTNPNEVSTLALVLYTMDPFNSAATADYIVLDKISLVANEFAIDTEPQTFDEVLRECEFYYEKSYENYTFPGTAPLTGSLIRVQTSNTDGTTMYFSYASTFEFEFKTLKRAVPTVTLYSANTGGAGQVLGTLYSTGVSIATNNLVVSTTWTPTISTKHAIYGTGSNVVLATSAAAPGQYNVFATASFNYVADARLGL